MKIFVCSIGSLLRSYFMDQKLESLGTTALDVCNSHSLIKVRNYKIPVHIQHFSSCPLGGATCALKRSSTETKNFSLRHMNKLPNMPRTQLDCILITQ